MTTTIETLHNMTMTQIQDLINMKERTMEMSATRIELLTKQNRKLQKKLENAKAFENLFNQAIELKQKQEEEQEDEEEVEVEEVPIRPKPKTKPKATPTPKKPKMTEEEKEAKRIATATARAKKNSEVVECDVCRSEITYENLRRHKKENKKCLRLQEKNEENE